MPKISNIEEKIIKDVYKLESRQIIQTVVKFTVFFVLFFLSLLYVIKNLIVLLREQQTLDLLELFNEDAEIIKNYFWETAITFFDETPKTNLVLILIIILLLIFMLLLLKIHIKKIVKKLTSISEYYKSQN